MKKTSILAAGLASVYFVGAAKSISKEREKYIISDTDLESDTEYKKKIVKRLKVDQVLDILEDLAISRLKVKELEERIKVYEQLEEKLNEEKNAEIEELKDEYETKLKKLSEPASGEVANDEFIAKIKKEGIDCSKVTYRVQVGAVNTYKDAEKLKKKVRALGMQTWILPLYNGYVIPLEIVLENIKENKC